MRLLKDIRIDILKFTILPNLGPVITVRKLYSRELVILQVSRVVNYDEDLRFICMLRISGWTLNLIRSCVFESIALL